MRFIFSDEIMSIIPKHGFKADEIINQGRTTKSKIEEIRKWLSQNKHIPPMSDEQITLFLIACSNVIENTEITIQNYFRMKSCSPELFSNRCIDTTEMRQTHSCA